MVNSLSLLKPSHIYNTLCKGLTLSANAFCGLRVEDTVPDHSTLSRFRSELSEKRAMHRLLAKLNAQLAHHGVLVHHGSILDASITPTLRKPHGKRIYTHSEEPGTPPTKEVKPGVDKEAVLKMEY